MNRWHHKGGGSRHGEGLRTRRAFEALFRNSKKPGGVHGVSSDVLPATPPRRGPSCRRARCVGPMVVACPRCSQESRQSPRDREPESALSNSTNETLGMPFAPRTSREKQPIRCTPLTPGLTSLGCGAACSCRRPQLSWSRRASARDACRATSSAPTGPQPLVTSSHGPRAIRGLRGVPRSCLRLARRSPPRVGRVDGPRRAGFLVERASPRGRGQGRTQ